MEVYEVVYREVEETASEPDEFIYTECVCGSMETATAKVKEFYEEKLSTLGKPSIDGDITTEYAVKRADGNSIYVSVKEKEKDVQDGFSWEWDKTYEWFIKRVEYFE